MLSWAVRAILISHAHSGQCGRACSGTCITSNPGGRRRTGFVGGRGAWGALCRLHAWTGAGTWARAACTFHGWNRPVATPCGPSTRLVRADEVRTDPFDEPFDTFFGSGAAPARPSCMLPRSVAAERPTCAPRGARDGWCTNESVVGRAHSGEFVGFGAGLTWSAVPASSMVISPPRSAMLA